MKDTPQWIKDSGAVDEAVTALAKAADQLAATRGWSKFSIDVHIDDRGPQWEISQIYPNTGRAGARIGRKP